MQTKAQLKIQKPQQNNVQHLFIQHLDLTHAEYSFHKEVDERGEVRSEVLSGNIKCVSEVLPNEFLLNWMLDTQKKYNGELVFLDEDQESIDKLYFEQGRCVELKLHYEPGAGASNVLVILTINAQKMDIGTVEYLNRYR